MTTKWRTWEGLDDEVADVVLELNGIDECWEMEQETRCHMLLVMQWASLERVERWRQQMGLRVSIST